MDRAANQGDLNLIYHLRGPLFAHIYRPADEEEGAGTTLWFAIEPQLNEDEENIKEMIFKWSKKNLIKDLEFIRDGEDEFVDKRGIISNQ